jgi:hypothetical protein
MRLIKELLQRFWFLALVLFPQVLPPYTSTGYSISEWGMVNAYILTHPIKTILTNITLVFQVVPLLLLVLIIIFGKSISRIFNIYVSIVSVTFFL